MLTLGWSDGNSFIPVNHCLLSAADDKNLLCDAANYDGRSFAGKRDIEVFFKSCKSYLRLVKECRSLSYNALTAHVSIVFTRYMMLSVAQRRNEDDKTICELFFCLMDELDDITFSQSMRIIIDALMDAVMEYFHITEQQLEEFTAINSVIQSP